MTISQRECTDWSTKGKQRHRSSVGGYPDPEIADDLALRVLLKLEELAEERGLEPDEVALCGVDSSSTAFAMAVLRLQTPERRYSFASGQKPETYGDGGELDVGWFALGEYGRVKLWVLVDDDCCTGRAISTVAWNPWVEEDTEVHWFGINMYFKLLESEDCDEVDVANAYAWLRQVTFHYWGSDDVGEAALVPRYRQMAGDRILDTALEVIRENEE